MFYIAQDLLQKTMERLTTVIAILISMCAVGGGGREANHNII